MSHRKTSLVFEIFFTERTISDIKPPLSRLSRIVFLKSGVPNFDFMDLLPGSVAIFVAKVQALCEVELLPLGSFLLQAREVLSCFLFQTGYRWQEAFLLLLVLRLRLSSFDIVRIANELLFLFPLLELLV